MELGHGDDRKESQRPMWLTWCSGPPHPEMKIKNEGGHRWREMLKFKIF